MFGPTVYLVRPLNEKCQAWLLKHTDGIWIHGCLTVEHRYIETLVEGLMHEGGFLEEIDFEVKH